MNKKILLISTIVLALDQISKAIIDITMKTTQSIEIIKNFFALTYYQNNGAGWGIFSGRVSLLILLTFLVLIIKDLLKEVNF